MRTRPDLREEFTAAMAHVAATVTVVTTTDRGTPVGVTVSSLVSLSLEPPLVLICLDKRTFLISAIHARRRFVVSVLSSDQMEVATRFAGLVVETRSRFDGLRLHWTETEIAAPADCSARLECVLRASYEGGDHQIMVGEVEHAETWADRAPLLRHDRGWSGVSRLGHESEEAWAITEAIPVALGM